MITKFSNEVCEEIGNLAALCVKLNREDFQIVFTYSGPSNSIHVSFYYTGTPLNRICDPLSSYLAVDFDTDTARVLYLRLLQSAVHCASRNRYFEQNPEKSISDYVKEVLGGEIG